MELRFRKIDEVWYRYNGLILCLPLLPHLNSPNCIMYIIKVKTIKYSKINNNFRKNIYTISNLLT